MMKHFQEALKRKPDPGRSDYKAAVEEVVAGLCAQYELGVKGIDYNIADDAVAITFRVKPRATFSPSKVAQLKSGLEGPDYRIQSEPAMLKISVKTGEKDVSAVAKGTARELAKKKYLRDAGTSYIPEEGVTVKKSETTKRTGFLWLGREEEYSAVRVWKEPAYAEIYAKATGEVAVTPLEEAEKGDEKLERALEAVETLFTPQQKIFFVEWGTGKRGIFYQ